jgi:hypothetical protein
MDRPDPGTLCSLFGWMARSIRSQGGERAKGRRYQHVQIRATSHVSSNFIANLGRPERKSNSWTSSLRTLRGERSLQPGGLTVIFIATTTTGSLLHAEGPKVAGRRALFRGRSLNRVHAADKVDTGSSLRTTGPS